MSNNESGSLERPVGELWVELSRDQKQKICNALIDHNQPDVLQEFASLIQFTRGYVHAQPTGSQQPAGGALSAPSHSPRDAPAPTPESEADKGPNDKKPKRVVRLLLKVGRGPPSHPNTETTSRQQPRPEV